VRVVAVASTGGRPLTLTRESTVATAISVTTVDKTAMAMTTTDTTAVAATAAMARFQISEIQTQCFSAFDRIC